MSFPSPIRLLSSFSPRLKSTFDTFVAMFSTGAIKGLLHGVGGENAENNWAFVLDGDVSDTLRHGLAYELKMASLALDDTSDTDDSIRIL